MIVFYDKVESVKVLNYDMSKKCGQCKSKGATIIRLTSKDKRWLCSKCVERYMAAKEKHKPVFKYASRL